MCNRVSGRWKMSSSSAPRWVAWMPLLLVSAFLYWTVALGLGGLSLMAASAISGDCSGGRDVGPTAIEPLPERRSAEPIIVHLEESPEPEDVNDNAGSAVPASDHDDDGTGELTAETR